MGVFTVSTLNDAGAGSLRAAIESANADTSGTPTVIKFTVGGSIKLLSDLPSIRYPTTIDGTSAPGYISGGPPLVELDCNGHAGLEFATGATGSQLLGLAIGHAGGHGVTLNARSVTLNGNYIGLDLHGAALGNAGDGVHVAATSSRNNIGYNPATASGLVSNVISGNGGNGISLHGSANNTLVSNRIGTNAAGAEAIANGGNGVWITGASDGNEIGGTAFTDTNTGEQNDPTGNKGQTTPVFVVPPLGNLVSGNAGNGILIDANSQNNVLNGNFVGTTADGNAALGNALDGVKIDSADYNFLIGCEFVQNPFVYYNVVSGNGGNGLHVTNSNNITVQANFFGIGADNTTIVGNALDGVLVDGSSRRVLFGGPIPLGNVSSGNGVNGIEVRDTSSEFTSFNTFSGLLAFKGAVPNGNDGILITATGGNHTIQTSAFSGNLNNGIEISGDASDVTVEPNIVGLDTSGSAPLPNGNNGVEINGTAHDNVVGGYQLSIAPRNIFSGNDGYGIAILGQAYNNRVFNSYIGTDLHGTFALANQKGGILIGDAANHNTIGGPPATSSRPVANVVSGNTGNGITLRPDTSFTDILNNVIGFASDGTTVLPNTGEPIAANGSADNRVAGNEIAPDQSMTMAIDRTGALGHGPDSAPVTTDVGTDTNNASTSINVPGSSDTTSEAVNNLRQILGSREDNGLASHGFLRSVDRFAHVNIRSGRFVDLAGIGDLRTILGHHVEVADHDTVAHGLTHDHQVLQASDVPSLSQGGFSGLNDRDHGLGYNADASGNRQSFLGVW